jgi:hypothetical protein
MGGMPAFAPKLSNVGKILEAAPPEALSHEGT